MSSRKKYFKYPRLNDIDWLKTKYLTEMLSTRQIAEILGCDTSSVGLALKRNSIPLRTPMESNAILHKYGRKRKRKIQNSIYDLLNSRDWLYQKFIIEKRSFADMAALSGCKSIHTIKKSLVKHNIYTTKIVRCEDDGFILNQSVITGCLLGDASLRKRDKLSDGAAPTFKRKNKYFDHVEYVGSLIFNKEFRHRIKEEISSNYLHQSIV